MDEVMRFFIYEFISFVLFLLNNPPRTLRIWQDKTKEEVMPNENCLSGMRCPKCKSYGPFIIAADVWAEVTDEGVEEYTDCEWNETRACICRACSHQATVNEFTTKAHKIAREKRAKAGKS
jgi:uncharacterized CHY-type Zn-finger protein